jgi:L-aspartate oxidase
MNIEEFEVLQTDVLVVGGGGAALRAALEADACGANVLLLSKGSAAKSGATYYSVAETGGFSCPNGYHDPSDSPEVFYHDIITAAQSMAVPRLAEVLAIEAIREKNYLESLGLEFARDKNNSYMCSFACFASKRRNLAILNHFKPILKVLANQFEKRQIKSISGITVTNLIVENGVCGGAFAIGKNKEKIMVLAKSVILAAGGGSRLFKKNMYPTDITGDGCAMAYRSGASIANMEFVQAGIGLAYPKLNLFKQHLWEALPSLTNAKGEKFLDKYIESSSHCNYSDIMKGKCRHFPFSSRDDSRYVEIAVQREINEGMPTSQGNVYVDFLNSNLEALIADKDSRISHIWPFAYNKYKELGINLFNDKLEIACFAHSMNGGVLTDEDSQSINIEGLFAAGEVATGQHGADRLGGNMAVACQVFGRRAGVAAAKHVMRKKNFISIKKAKKRENLFLSQLRLKSDVAIDLLFEKIHDGADKNLLVVRNESGIKNFLNSLSEIENEIKLGTSRQQSNVPLVKLYELNNLIEIGKLISRAALERKESRGSHYRTDFPKLDENLSKMHIFNDYRLKKN